MHDVEHNLCLGSRENYFIHFHTSSFSPPPSFFLPITLTLLPHTDSVEQLLYLHKFCFHSSAIIQKPTAVLLKKKKKRYSAMPLIRCTQIYSKHSCVLKEEWEEMWIHHVCSQDILRPQPLIREHSFSNTNSFLYHSD